MKRQRDVVAEGRAQTDASLGAERATADAIITQMRADAQRELDVLIARDRVLADRRLVMFRRSADEVLAEERSGSPARSGPGRGGAARHR